MKVVFGKNALGNNFVLNGVWKNYTLLNTIAISFFK